MRRWYEAHLPTQRMSPTPWTMWIRSSKSCDKKKINGKISENGTKTKQQQKNNFFEYDGTNSEGIVYISSKPTKLNNTSELAHSYTCHYISIDLCFEVRTYAYNESDEWVCY